MKSLTHLIELNKSKERLESKEKLSESEIEELSYLKQQIWRLSKLKKGLDRAEELIGRMQTKYKIEKIYNEDYLCIYMKVNKPYKLDYDVMLFKDMCKTSYSETKWCDIQNKEILFKFNSPPAFYGYYIDYTILKLSIPVFSYHNDIDIMNFIDRHFQSLTRKIKQIV